MLIDTRPGDFRSPENTVPLTQHFQSLADGMLYAERINVERTKETQPVDDKNLSPQSLMIKRRISSMFLPIIFTSSALIIVPLYADTVPAALVLLCDALTYFERGTVTAQSIATMYPNGFYNPSILQKIIEGEMRPRIHKWNHVFEPN
jgi:hypothetical protein